MKTFILLFALLTAYAQESIHYASISGRVTDPSGGVIAAAQVTARQTATNLTTTLLTDQEGRFRFPYLKVGLYEITAKHTGFAPFTRTLTLSLGSAFELPISLALESKDTAITVTADASFGRPRCSESESQVVSSSSSATQKLNLPG